MKLLKVLSIVTLLSLAAPSHAIDPDKVQHFAVSAGINVGLYLLLGAILHLPKQDKRDALPMSIFMTLCIGFGKEWGDTISSPGSKFDMGDMGANAAGVGASSLGILLLNF